MSDYLLEMRQIRKAYPGVMALSSVDLKVRSGEVHGLMGENGAGKSTLIKILAGAIRPNAGEILYDGKSYDALTPRLAHDIGIGVIYQEFNLVPHMTVADNIYLGNEFTAGPFTRPARAVAEAGKLLTSLGIDIDPRTEVRHLTVAYQQMVEIAKAVSKKVRLLIMDEPTAPLANSEVSRLYDLIARLKAQGIAIIYISHRLEEIFHLTDTVTVLRDGQHIQTAPTHEMARDKLISLMVGRPVSETYPRGGFGGPEVVLDVRNLSGGKFADVSFQLHRGEVLGIGGLVGSGRTEIARAIFGADPSRGEIVVNGQPAHISSPGDATRLGIALIPEDRKHQGLLLRMTVAQNATLAASKKFEKGGFLSLSDEATAVRARVAALRIKVPGLDHMVATLSGGNQQKVVIAKWLETGASILILDEPTRGIDVGAKQEIYRLIRELTARGLSILVISSDMPELIGLSDRVLVVCRGRIAGQLDRDEISQDRIMELAAG